MVETFDMRVAPQRVGVSASNLPGGLSRTAPRRRCYVGAVGAGCGAPPSWKGSHAWVMAVPGGQAAGCIVGAGRGAPPSWGGAHAWVMAMPSVQAAVCSCARRCAHRAAEWVIQPVLLVHRGCAAHQCGGIWCSVSNRRRSLAKRGHSANRCRALAASAEHQGHRELVSLCGSWAGRQWRRVVVLTAPPRQICSASRSRLSNLFNHFVHVVELQASTSASVMPSRS